MYRVIDVHVRVGFELYCIRGRLTLVLNETDHQGVRIIGQCVKEMMAVVNGRKSDNLQWFDLQIENVQEEGEPSGVNKFTRWVADQGTPMPMRWYTEINESPLTGGVN